MERNEAILGRSFRSSVQKSCLGPSRILGLASKTSTNDNLLRMAPHNNSVFVEKGMCPPPSTVTSIATKQYYISARSFGPFGPPKEEKKKGSNKCSCSS